MSNYAVPFAVEVAPERDLEDLLEAAAGRTERIGPPWPVEPRFRAQPEELDTDDEDAPDRDAPTLAGEPLPDAPSPSDQMRGGRVLEAVYKTDDHPRWPAGTPGGKGGEWMRVGEHFTSGGKEWEIAHIVKGKIYAHEASGKAGKAETREFAVAKAGGQAHVPEAEAPVAPKVPKGGKSASNVTVVDAYVDPATHDPSIPLPDHALLTPQQWSRFGKVDQEHYVELMERFGKHKPGAAKKHVDAAYQEYQDKVQELVKNAYGQQYGSSSGYSLSIAAGAKHGYGGHGVQATADMAKLREQALALQAEHKAAVQWDLYNRTKSPDVFVVHKDGDHGPDWWHSEFIAGDKPIMSGLSQSFSYRRSFFGTHGIASPLAIRHVLMSTASAQPVPGAQHFPGELEIATSEQLKLDKRSLAFTAGHGKNKLSASQIAWLEGMTNEPVGGHVLDTLKDSLENGTYLPPPPKPPKILMDGAGGQTWVDPDVEMAKPPFSTAGLPTSTSETVKPEGLLKDLPWTTLDEHGHPKALTGKDAGVKSGQYFMGLKGTLYWVGPDPGNTSGYPYRIHKITGGEFNGENFAYNPDLPGYYLEGTQVMPDKDADGIPDFAPHEWVKSTDSKFLDQFEVGEKFKLEGTSYEVTGKGMGGQVKIQDLESGLTGQINGDFKSTWLVPLGSTEASPEALHAKPVYKDGDLVHTAFGLAKVDAVEDVETPGGGSVQYLHVTHAGHNFQMDFPENEVKPYTAHTAAAAGVTFEHEGSKAVVTKIRKDGTIQANLKPGQLLISPEDWNAQYAQGAFDPSAHQISSEKVKLRDMAVGDRFQGGAGNNTMRPYEVVHKDEASKTVGVMNLDTGEVTQLSKHQSYRPLLAKADSEQAAPVPDKGTPVETTGGGHVGPPWDPSKFELSGEKGNLSDIPDGSYYQTPGGGIVHKIGNKPDGVAVQVIQDAHGTVKDPGVEHLTLDYSFADDQQVDLYQLKGPGSAETPAGEPPVVPDTTPGKFDPSSFVEGDLLKIGDMPGGTIFKTNSKKGEAYYQLSDDGTKTTNLLTGKVYDAKPKWKATTMLHESVDDTDAGADEALSQLEGKLKRSKQIKAGDLKPGDEFVFPETGQKGIATHTQEGAPPNMTMVAAANTGPHVKGVPVPNDIVLHKAKPSEAKPSQALIDKYPEGDVAELTPEAAEFYGVDHGQIVDHGHVTVKIAKGGKTYDVSAEGIKAVHDLGNWAEAKNAAAEMAAADAAEAKMASPVGTNKQAKSFGDLKPGAVFSPAHGGIQYVKGGTPGIAAKVGAEPGDVVTFPDDYVPDDLHSEPLDQSHVGQKVTVTDLSDPMPKTKTGYVQKVRDSDGAAQLFGSVKWHKPEYVQVHDEHLPAFEGGDQVTVAEGGDFGGSTGTFMGWGSDFAGQPAALVDFNGDLDPVQVSPSFITKVAPGTGQEQQGVPLTPKATHTEVPYDQLEKGDAVQAEWLKGGDQFYVGPGHLVQVMGAPYEDGHEKHVPVADVLPGGLTGPMWKVHAGHGGTLANKADDAEPAELPSKVEAEDLPDAVQTGGMVPYMHHKGGQFVYAQIGMLPEGALFQDKGGQKWKVKQAGQSPIISNGYEHFTVSPSLRGKDLSQLNGTPVFIDTAGPVGGGGQPVHAQAAEATVVANTLGASLGNMQLKPGDYLKPDAAANPDGHVWQYVAPPTAISGHKVGDTETGAVTFLPDHHVPAAHAPSTVIFMSAAPDFTGEEAPAEAPAPSLYTEAVPASSVSPFPGSKIALAPGSSQVYDVKIKHGGGGITVEPTDGGPYVAVKPTDTVYKQAIPEAPTEPPVPVAKPPADPAEDVPLVHGPDDFEEPGDVAALDPNFSMTDPLNGFNHPKGYGSGIGFDYPHINTLQVGQKFTDKSGKDYRLVSHGSGASVFEDISTGSQYWTPSTTRVKLTALPPDPGPQLKPLVVDLVHKYGDLENVPTFPAEGFASTTGASGKAKTKNPMAMKFGQPFQDAVGHPFISLAAWGKRALVLDAITNEPVLIDGRKRYLPT